MNGVSERDAAFLAEMGVGPLWRLRAVPAAEPAQQQAAVAGQPQAGAAPGRPAATLADEQRQGVAASPRPAAAPAGEQRQGGAAPARPAPAPVAPREHGAPPADQEWGDVQAYAVQGAPPPALDPAAAAEADAAAVLAIASMDWDELRAAVAACTRCGACRDGGKAVFGAGARQAHWLVAAGATTGVDEQAGQPLAGEPGKLLDNMLAAVGLSRERDAYVTNLVKCRPASANGGERAPTAAEAAACRPYLERELALTGAATVLTLGQIAANGLLGKPLQEPLAGARGAVHALGQVPLVATLHPGELLRRGADKALAWADLCRAKAAHARPG